MDMRERDCYRADRLRWWRMSSEACRKSAGEPTSIHSFEEMYLHHAAEHADITVAAIPYAVSVPYAILTTDGARVTGIDEKPTYSHYANAGIYIFRNAVLRTLRAGERTDATDLIERCISGGGRVAYYPIRGTWIDVAYGMAATVMSACSAAW